VAAFGARISAAAAAAGAGAGGGMEAMSALYVAEAQAHARALTRVARLEVSLEAQQQLTAAAEDAAAAMNVAEESEESEEYGDEDEEEGEEPDSPVAAIALTAAASVETLLAHSADKKRSARDLEDVGTHTSRSPPHSVPVLATSSTA